MQVQETYGGEDFTLVTVTDAPADEAAAFAFEERVTFPVLAGAALTRAAYGVDLIWGSTFFLVDPAGEIVATELEQAEERLAEELGAPPSGR